MNVNFWFRGLLTGLTFAFSTACLGLQADAAGWCTCASPTTTQPTVVAFPGATSVPPAGWAQPSLVNCGQPACTPSAVASQPVAAAPWTANYVPVYRASWFRAPVTTYRVVPVATPAFASAAVAPTTVATVQPCNTYQWQARRVPTWFRFWRPAAPTVNPVYMPATSSPAVASLPCGNCSSGSIAAQPSPYYSLPSSPTSFPAAVPQTSPTPADNPPRLDPADLQIIPSSAANRIRLPGAQLSTPQYASARQSADSNATSSPSAARLHPPEVTPIPDQRRQDANAVNQAGVLKLPAPPPSDDHTASSPAHSGSTMPVSWPAPHTATVPQSAGAPQNAAVSVPPPASPAPPAQVVWDDRGWQSEQPRAQ